LTDIRRSNIITIMMIRSDIPEKAQAIASAAVEAIHDRGLDRFKLTDVARKAGVTTGAVTYYFEDKDELLIAAFDETWRRMFSEIASYDGGWTLERFEHSLPVSDARKRGWSVWLSFCGRAQSSEEINRHYRESYSLLEDLLAESANSAGQSVTKDAIRSVIAAMDGIGLCATLHPDLWPAERQRETLRSMVGHLFRQS